MTSIQDFDVRSRGISELVSQWTESDDGVRLAWRPADLVEAYVDLLRAARELFLAYAQNGEFPNRDVRFSYFTVVLESLLKYAAKVAAVAGMIEAEGEKVAGLAVLRELTAFCDDILAEDRFATDMAFSEKWD